MREVSRKRSSVLKNSLVPFSEPRLGTQSPSFAVFWSGFGYFRPSFGSTDSSGNDFFNRLDPFVRQC
jgi:hypothetical protein